MSAVLLAVDVGLRTGLAWFNCDGQLVSYRSQHYPNRSQLRRGIRHILLEEPDIRLLVLEGGGPIANIWQTSAVKVGIKVIVTSAEEWRQVLLLRREQRSGVQAKKQADRLARKVVDWSGAPKPTSLTHDVAEAILIGMWGTVHVGISENFPDALHR